MTGTNWSDSTINATNYTDTTINATNWDNDGTTEGERLLENGNARYLETGDERILQ